MTNKRLIFSGLAFFLFLFLASPVNSCYPYDKEMEEWFRQDAGSSDKKWKFVVLHRSPYNLGGHHVSWGKNVWPDLFQKYRIDVIFSGHSHLYERYYPIEPGASDWVVTYITTGGAGASLAEANRHPSLAYSRSLNHFLLVSLNKDHIDIRAVKSDGTVIDSVAWDKKKGVISAGYLATSFPKEEMDVVNVFNSTISQRIGGLPMVHVPYESVMYLDGSNVTSDVEYEIRLANESNGKYIMEPVKGVLKAGTTRDVPLRIFSRTTMTVSKWGTLTPVLRLVAGYKTKKFEGAITGGRLEYIAY